MQDDVGVGGIIGLALCAWIGGHWVAEHAEQPLARGLFHLKLFGAHPPVAHRDATVLDMEGIDHAVAIEPVIVALSRWI